MLSIENQLVAEKETGFIIQNLGNEAVNLT